MHKSVAILLASFALALSAHAAEPGRGPTATPATPAQPATPAAHEAGKPTEPPKATPATPAQPAVPASATHEDKGKHKGAAKGKKKNQQQ